MHARVALLLLTACGRIAFDARDDAGAQPILDDTLPIDGITVTAPCGMPTLLGTGDVAGSLAVAAGSDIYRVTWVDAAAGVHVMTIVRAGESLTTSEQTFVGGAGLPMPVGADVAVSASGISVMTYFNATSCVVRHLLPSPGITGPMASSTSPRVTALVTSGSQLYRLYDSASLYFTDMDPLTLATGPLVTVTNLALVGPTIGASSAAGAIVAGARGNLNECLIWSYDSARALLGTTMVPTDTSGCSAIAVAYSEIADATVIAYKHGTPIALARIDPSGATVAGPIDVGNGTEPGLAASGNLFRMIYRTGPLFELHNANAVVAAVSTESLSGRTTPIRSAAITTGVGEAVAVWAEDGATNEIWLRRLCAP